MGTILEGAAVASRSAQDVDGVVNAWEVGVEERARQNAMTKENNLGGINGWYTSGKPRKIS